MKITAFWGLILAILAAGLTVVLATAVKALLAAEPPVSYLDYLKVYGPPLLILMGGKKACLALVRARPN